MCVGVSSNSAVGMFESLVFVMDQAVKAQGNTVLKFKSCVDFLPKKIKQKQIKEGTKLTEL